MKRGTMDLDCHVPADEDVPINEVEPVRFADVAVVLVAFLMPIAVIGGLAYPHVTPRQCVLFAVLPLGILELVRRCRREAAHAVALGYLTWLGSVSVLTLGFWWLRGVTGREVNFLTTAGFVSLWALASGTTAQARTRALGAFAISVSLSGLVAIVQLLTVPQTGILTMIGNRASGLTTSPVEFGANAGAAAILVVALSSHQRWAKFSPVFFGWFCLLVNLSGSRVVLLATGLICAIVMTRERVSAWKALTVAGIVGTVLGNLFMSQLSTPVSAVSRLGSGRLDGRLTVWRYGLESVASRPWGYGTGRFREAVQGHFSPTFIRTHAASELSASWRDPHNVIIHQLVETGIPGFLLVVAFLYFAVKRSSGPALWAASLFGLVWLVQPIALATGPVAFLLLGLSYRERSVQAPRSRSRTRELELIAVALGVALSGVTLVSDLKWNAAMESGNPLKIEQAARWWPGDAGAANLTANSWSAVANTLGRPDWWERSLNWSGKAVEREPGSTYWLNNQAYLRFHSGDFFGAEESAEEVLRLQEWNPTALGLLIEIRRLTGRDTTDLEHRLCQVQPDCRVEALGES